MRYELKISLCVSLLAGGLSGAVPALAQSLSQGFSQGQQPSGQQIEAFCAQWGQSSGSQRKQFGDQYDRYCEEQLNSVLLLRGEPAAGLVVPADRRHAEISHLVMDHLGGSGRVYMRISALQEGVMVASSPLRRLNAP